MSFSRALLRRSVKLGSTNRVLSSLVELVRQFLPQEGAAPKIGEVANPEFVEEDKVEVVVADTEGKNEIRKAVEQLKKVHPYEEVAFEVYRLEDI